MALDITNPATYDEGFKTLLRQKGYAGRKDVSVDELEALYVDYSGKQEQDTKVATNLLSSVAADPAPYTGAMTNQDTFQGDQSFDLTQMNPQGGSGPIFSTVQAVDEQEALKRQQAEQAAAQPDPNDEFRMVAQERLLPVIDAIKQKRASAAGIKNSWDRRDNLRQVDQLAASRINDLVRDNVISSQDADLITKRSEATEGRMTYEESLRGFLFDRMNPQQNKTAAGVNPEAEEAESKRRWMINYELGEINKNLEAVPEGTPERENLLRTKAQLTQEYAERTTPRVKVQDLDQIDKERNRISRLLEVNPDLGEGSGLVDMFSQNPIQSREEADAYLNRLNQRRATQLVDIESSPESWEFLTSARRDFKDAEEYAAWEKEAPENTPYINELGKFTIKNPQSPNRGGPKQTLSLSADNPFKDEYESAEGGTEQLNTDVAVRQLNRELTAYKLQREGLKDAPAPFGSKTWRGSQWEKLSKKIDEIESRLNELQSSK